MDQDVTLYHNPRCSKSREALKLLHDNGITPSIVLYLETPPDAAALAQLVHQLGFASARELMRHKEVEYKTLKLDRPELSEAALIAAMVAHPVLIERPIAVANDVARIGRPPELVLEVLR